MALPDNIVTLICPVTEAPVYVNESFVISQGGQAVLPPKASQIAGGWALAVNCDTNPSSQVAEEFIHVCGGDNHVYSSSTIRDLIPSELSFFFAFTFQFPINGGSSAHKLYFGQGKKLTVHNWWIGGSSLVSKAGGNFSAQETVLIALNASRDAVTQVFGVGGENNNKFSMAPWFATSARGAEQTKH